MRCFRASRFSAEWPESFRVANIDERIASSPFGVTPEFDLDTQKSHDWEAGVRLSYAGFNVQSSYYDMRSRMNCSSIP